MRLSDYVKHLCAIATGAGSGPVTAPTRPHFGPTESERTAPTRPAFGPDSAPIRPHGGDYRGGEVEVGGKGSEEEEKKNPPSPRRGRQKKAKPAHLEDATPDNPPLPERLAPFAEPWKTFLEYRAHVKKPALTVYGATSNLKRFENFPPAAFRGAIETAIEHGWQGLFYDGLPAGWNGSASNEKGARMPQPEGDRDGLLDFTGKRRFSETVGDYVPADEWRPRHADA